MSYSLQIVTGPISALSIAGIYKFHIFDAASAIKHQLYNMGHEGEYTEADILGAVITLYSNQSLY